MLRINFPLRQYLPSSTFSVCARLMKRASLLNIKLFYHVSVLTNLQIKGPTLLAVLVLLFPYLVCTCHKTRANGGYIYKAVFNIDFIYD